MRFVQLSTLLVSLWMVTGCDSYSGSSLTLDTGTPGQVREASLGLVSEAWEATADSLEWWARRLGGHTVNRSRDTDRRIRLELQVPVSAADTFLYLVRRLGRVFDERIERHAATAQRTDLETQLKEKEEAIQSYEKRLKTAASREEINDLENTLRSLREEYRKLRRKLDELQAQTAYVHIYLQIENAAYADLKEGGRFWPKFTKGLKDGWYIFQYFLIGMAYLWWMWLGLGLIIVLARWHHRRQQRKKPPMPPAGA